MTELFAFLARHPILSLALAGITLALLYTELSRFWQGFKSLKPAALTALVNREDALLIDIRAMNEFQQGHIAGSKNVLMSQFDPESKQLASAKSLPVVVVCKTGTSAAGAAKRLVKAGFEKVYVLEGGIGAWEQAGLPLLKGKR
ncbi:MAG: rhodanese-like domain-containing protein [Pseudomonadota bacterium]|nr:rhodanese-like domain-containing protein [Pseudomonadota bacterium]